MRGRRKTWHVRIQKHNYAINTNHTNHFNQKVVWLYGHDGHITSSGPASNISLVHSFYVHKPIYKHSCREAVVSVRCDKED